MSLLAGVNYDPSTAVSHPTTSNKAMATFHAADGSFPQLTFTTPAAAYDGSHAAVLARIRATVVGSTSLAQILLGVMESTTVKLRMMPIGAQKASAIASTAFVTQEVLAVIPGLTPSTSLTWDAAYGVEDSVTSTAIKYGGPNNTTTNDAWGGLAFELYDCPNLLGACLYDPAASVGKSTSALLAQTVFDTTNLRIVFTGPASGSVLVRIRTMTTKANTAQAMVLLGVVDTANGTFYRASPIGGNYDTTGLANRQGIESSFLVTGLTPGNSYTWDASYGVEIVGSGGTPIIGYGGPNNTTGDDAYGAISYTIWAV